MTVGFDLCQDIWIQRGILCILHPQLKNMFQDCKVTELLRPMDIHDLLGKQCIMSSHFGSNIL